MLRREDTDLIVRRVCFRINWCRLRLLFLGAQQPRNPI
jgi:hypothetical protein